MGAAIKVKDVSKLDETKDDIIYIMREEHDIKNPEKEDDFEVMTMVEAIGMINNVVNGINALLIALANISCCWRSWHYEHYVCFS